jgi:hypothetical protein
LAGFVLLRVRRNYTQGVAFPEEAKLGFKRADRAGPKRAPQEADMGTVLLIILIILLIGDCRRGPTAAAGGTAPPEFSASC